MPDDKPARFSADSLSKYGMVLLALASSGWAVWQTIVADPEAREAAQIKAYHLEKHYGEDPVSEARIETETGFIHVRTYKDEAGDCYVIRLNRGGVVTTGVMPAPPAPEFEGFAVHAAGPAKCAPLDWHFRSKIRWRVIEDVETDPNGWVMRLVQFDPARNETFQGCIAWQLYYPPQTIKWGDWERCVRH